MRKLRHREVGKDLPKITQLVQTVELTCSEPYVYQIPHRKPDRNPD